MRIEQITDKDRIQKFLLKDPYLHTYEMGDLQEQLFKHIKWNAAVDGGDIKALSMLYESKEPLFFCSRAATLKQRRRLLQNWRRGFRKKFTATFPGDWPGPWKADTHSGQGTIILK